MRPLIRSKWIKMWKISIRSEERWFRLKLPLEFRQEYGRSERQ